MTKRERRRRDRQIGQIVLDYTRKTRTDPRAELPFTGGWIQRKARLLGIRVGEHRALRIARVLREDGYLEPYRSYRPKYRNQAGSAPYRIQLYLVSKCPARSSSLYPQVTRVQVRIFKIGRLRGQPRVALAGRRLPVGGTRRPPETEPKARIPFELMSERVARLRAATA